MIERKTDLGASSPASTSALHEREGHFHDAWACSTPTDEVLVRECFEAPTALENQFILKRLGALEGTRLLDIGAGLGESSVYFALRGARVTTVDVSPRMVEKAIELGKKYGVELEGVVSDAEDLKVPEGEYDTIYIANTIHHIRDRATLFEQMSRALKPGGVFFSCDPLAYNPVINVYRKMATQVRTEDEAPLTIADIRLAKKYFRGVGHREFWISTLALFLKYLLVDRVHPNQDRYWKRILREKAEDLWWWTPFRALDAALTRIPGVRWMAWNLVMWGQKHVKRECIRKDLKPLAADFQKQIKTIL
jgi:SAM-dependent methyltransferase